jgi:N-methylhydantoinase A
MTWLSNVGNGGTTTGFCLVDGGEMRYTKTLTTPYDLSRCLFDGLAKASELAYGRPRLAVLLQSTDCIRYFTTQGTNAPVQRAGPQLGLLITDPARVEGLAATTARAQEDLLAALIGDRWRPVSLDVGDDEALSRELTARVNDLSARGQAPGHRGERLGRHRRGGAGQGLYPRHLLGAVPLLFSWELVADPYDIRAPGRACSTRSCTRPLSASCSTPTGGCETPWPRAVADLPLRLISCSPRPGQARPRSRDEAGPILGATGPGLALQNS